MAGLPNAALQRLRARKRRRRRVVAIFAFGLAAIAVLHWLPEPKLSSRHLNTDVSALRHSDALEGPSGHRDPADHVSKDRIRGEASPNRGPGWSRPQIPRKPAEYSCSSPWNLIVSFGGVGTTASIGALATGERPLLLNNCDDKEGLKHRTWEPTVRRIEELHKMWNCSAVHQPPHPVSRVIYVYADPVHAIMSLYRRRYIFEQFEKVPEPSLDKFDALQKYPTVLQYAEAGDPMGLEAHWDNWEAVGRRCNQVNGAPVLFIDARLLRPERGDATAAITDFFQHGRTPKFNMNGYDNDFAFEKAPRYKSYLRDSGKMLNVSNDEIQRSVTLLENTYARLRRKMQDLHGAHLTECA